MEHLTALLIMKIVAGEGKARIVLVLIEDHFTGRVAVSKKSSRFKRYTEIRFSNRI